MSTNWVQATSHWRTDGLTWNSSYIAKLPDGEKERRPPVLPEDFDVRDEVSKTLGGGEVVDLWYGMVYGMVYGVEYGYRPPHWDAAPDLSRAHLPKSHVSCIPGPVRYL